MVKVTADTKVFNGEEFTALRATSDIDKSTFLTSKALEIKEYLKYKGYKIRVIPKDGPLPHSYIYSYPVYPEIQLVKLLRVLNPLYLTGLRKLL